MITKNISKKIVENLKQAYPEAKCSLDFSTPFELVVAVMLSAQCTDERVNKTTPLLFRKCATLEDYANIDISELERIIHPCGFYKNKAKNIKLCANQILNTYNGAVPNKIDDLIKLAGVGRKSANVIMLEVFGIAEGIAVDTHCKRLSNRLGFSNNTIPEKIEQDLLSQIEPKYYKDVNHLFIYHGREICKSKNPRCENCTIKNYCAYYKSTIQKA